MMRKIAVGIFALTWIASLIIVCVAWDHHALAISLIGHLSIIGLVLMSTIEDGASDPVRESCEGCRHNLGAGNCRINLEHECRDGGGFEMWEDDDD